MREKGRDRVAEAALGERSVGTERTECILPVGSIITAVGDLHSVIDRADAFPVRREHWRWVLPACRHATPLPR